MVKFMRKHLKWCSHFPSVYQIETLAHCVSFLLPKFRIHRNGYELLLMKHYGWLLTIIKRSKEKKGVFILKVLCCTYLFHCLVSHELFIRGYC